MANAVTTPYAILIHVALQHTSPIAKIKCLCAARSAPEITPAQRAYASFAAAELLLHTYTSSEGALEEAKALLLSAERDLKSCRLSNARSTARYLATLSLLGQCQLLLGEAASAASSFLSGARAAASASFSASDLSPSSSYVAGGDPARWQAHFLLFLARIEPDREKVKEHLKAVETLKIDDPVCRTVLALSNAIEAMQRGDMGLADQYLATTATELARALRGSSTSSETAKHFIESLRAHYYLIYALNAQMSGRTAQLASEGTYPAYEEFFKAVDRLDRIAEDRERNQAYGEKDFESFLPPLDDGDLKACGEMMYNNVLRVSSSGTGAGTGSGQKVLDTIASIPQSTTENTFITSKHGKFVQLLEYEAMQALATCDFQQAARILVEALRKNRDAAYLNDGGLKSTSLPLLIGQYLHSTREYDAALALLGGLWSGSEKSGDARAAPRAALVELERNNVNGAVSRMAELVEAIDVDKLPAHERAVVQMVNGIILFRQDDTTGARLLLTKALKQAHGMIGSGQFVGQILNCLAPVQQMRQDHSGALQMLESSATLLKSAKDLTSLVTTLVAMEKFYCESQQSDKAASCRQYIEKKNAELRKRLQSVHGSGAHKELLHMISS